MTNQQKRLTKLEEKVWEVSLRGMEDNGTIPPNMEIAKKVGLRTKQHVQNILNAICLKKGAKLSQKRVFEFIPNSDDNDIDS